MEYHVTWTIEVNADNPTAAAERALELVRAPNSTATVFEVVENEKPAVFFNQQSYRVDLTEGTCDPS